MTMFLSSYLPGRKELYTGGRGSYTDGEIEKAAARYEIVCHGTLSS